MKARALKKIMNDTRYIIHETDQHICVGSPLCHDLISVRKDNLQLRYALDTFHKGKVSIGDGRLVKIWETLERLISTGEIHEIISGEDVIENPLPVFGFDGVAIIRSFTDEYGWPNTDIAGRLMYENTWFSTEREAVECAISCCHAKIRWLMESLENKRGEIANLEEKIQTSNADLAKFEEIIRFGSTGG